MKKITVYVQLSDLSFSQNSIDVFNSDSFKVELQRVEGFNHVLPIEVDLAYYNLSEVSYNGGVYEGVLTVKRDAAGQVLRPERRLDVGQL